MKYSFNLQFSKKNIKKEEEEEDNDDDDGLVVPFVSKNRPIFLSVWANCSFYVKNSCVQFSFASDRSKPIFYLSHVIGLHLQIYAITKCPTKLTQHFSFCFFSSPSSSLLFLFSSCFSGHLSILLMLPPSFYLNSSIQLFSAACSAPFQRRAEHASSVGSLDFSRYTFILRPPKKLQWSLVLSCLFFLWNSDVQFSESLFFDFLVQPYNIVNVQHHVFFS